VLRTAEANIDAENVSKKIKRLIRKSNEENEGNA